MPRHAIPNDSPFQPGPGLQPPVLAGRKREKDRLRLLYSRLSAGRAPAAPAVLTGPRGNGKTVLLRWLQQKIEEIGAETLWLTPRRIPTAEALAEQLGGKSRRSIEKISGTLGAAGATLEAGVKLDKLPRHAPPDIAALLRQHAEKRGFALLIDEAHTLNPEVGGELLDAGQMAAGENAPFLLALAGTPDLPDALNRMSATFWSRAEKIGVELIDDAEAARDSMERPMAEADLRLEEPQLWDRIVADSQGYPYFLQLWGTRLWTQAIGRECPAVLTRADVEAAQAEVNRDRTAYYELRYAELLNEDLLAPARTVARLFMADGAPLPRKEILVEAAASAVGQDRARALGAVTRLAHLGFVWNAPGESFWSPGIPSLMRYVCHQPPAPDSSSP